MTEKFDAVVPKLSPLIRMLSSNGTEREIANAGRAIIELLASAGLDIHALAERVEHGGDEQLTPPRCSASTTRVSRMALPRAPSMADAVR